MSLPKLNSMPSYETTIPSTKQKIHYRPFLVREEKILMIAQESGEIGQIVDAISNTLSACIEEPINIKSLATFDIEYLFVQLRAKSVGEKATVGLKCSNCDHSNEVTIKLDDIKIEVPKVDNIIPLTDQISVKVGWPTYKDVSDSNILNSTSVTDQTFRMIASSIISVLTPDEAIAMKDQPKEDVIAFVESLNNEQFKKIQEFVAKAPVLTHKIEFVCEKCSEPNEIVLQGLRDFF